MDTKVAWSIIFLSIGQIAHLAWHVCDSVTRKNDEWKQRGRI